MLNLVFARGMAYQMRGEFEAAIVDFRVAESTSDAGVIQGLPCVLFGLTRKQYACRGLRPEGFRKRVCERGGLE